MVLFLREEFLSCNPSVINVGFSPQEVSASPEK
ncbi:hypothetical protein A2U01_0082443, partial [Trifolium medium]|nr:hypothetical protein [Trifolium medium]